MDRLLFTIGYEGRNLEPFVSSLKANNIKCLLDVREIPLSRKKGFSKSALSACLAENDIKYIHFKQLGSPKEVRKQLKASGNYRTFFQAMNRHLIKVADTINDALNYVNNTTCCLMCFEKQAENCHRSLVAEKIKERDGNGLKIKNI